MKTRTLLLIVIFISAGVSCLAQDTAFLQNAFKRLEQQPAQEKVYLHLDKPNYGYGDTIWYKAYTVTGQKHRLSTLSGVLYVELISPADSLIARQTVPMVSGIGWSEIPLAHSLKQGIYRIRAYTRWMLNNGPGYFYDQCVRIGGLQPQIIKQAVQTRLDVQFFPEGGQMVYGVRSRVAIKALGANGLGQNIKGTIEDNTGNVVADFETHHLGMGEFALTPAPGKSYRAKIDAPGETTWMAELPRAQEIGYVLALNNSDADSIYLRVATNETTLTRDKGRAFFIIGQNGGKVFYTTRGELNGTAYAAKVEKSRFPDGIVQFTLFGQSGEPLAERIAFVDNTNEMKLSVGTDKADYKTREKVQIALGITDSSVNTARASFSVAVINENSVQQDENAESTILNNLLLTSELKGYIEQPNYYFTNKSDQARADLDNLMLTQGYRRYEWKRVLDNKFEPLVYKPETSLELSGTLATPAGKPIPHGSVTLAATKEGIFRDTVADDAGRFTFTGLYLTDTSTVVLRARKANKGSNVKIKADVPDYPAITPAGNINEAPVIIDTSKQTPAAKQYIQYQQAQKTESQKYGISLKTVSIKGYKRPPKPDLTRSSNLHGGGNADRVIMGKDLGYCINLSDCLGDKLVGIGFRGMSVIVDGVNIGVGRIDDVSPNEIYSIEVLYRTFSKSVYGSSISKAGALIITTKNGSENEETVKVPETAAQLQYNQYALAQRQDSMKYGKTLKTVTITGLKRPQQPVIPNSSNLHGGGNADQVIMADDMGIAANLEDGLRRKIFGVTFDANGVPVNLRGNGARMSVIVDGVTLTNTSINDVNVLDVYSVEVLRTSAARAIYGSSIDAGGALVITTKRGTGVTKTDAKQNIAQLQYNRYAVAQKRDSLKNGRTLKTVTITGRKRPKQPELINSSNLNGPGHANQVLMYDQLDNCIDLADCLNGKVPGVTFDGAGNAKPMRSHSGNAQVKYMRVIVDGVMLDPEATLNDVNASDIYSIEVLRSSAYLAIYGSNAPLGAFVITTKRGGEKGTAYFTQAQPNGIMNFPFTGFYKAKAFYMPKYQHPIGTKDLDNRTTVYWNPNIITDKDGKALLEFYNNDSKGSYRVVVEGIDENGTLGRAVYHYKVE
ncbi:carboxypeptidase-like regulatory domain-containing protein [Mucilaginibacter ginsenosidivorans]|uniref:TonB-dependent receptor plug domain-containing protein n=1 Tax=Mucilaginibacter ginsenosidivorans TaxID=398053 RepID=A0A5B8UQB1_9SPHI|nr:carboxypeptidase-like regulatory domain-containing protein [Mucilaginibacter ginsenosidivorans]QEC61062.1 hypothetical protein FRZ54_00190 [Mucilaginibacter ginsenosidivorans]